jgi:hypothetical protein
MSLELKIVEGIEGYYVYHLSKSGKNMQPALCGNSRVMSTNASLRIWGFHSHLNEKYCTECEKIANSEFLLFESSKK